MDSIRCTTWYVIAALTGSCITEDATSTDDLGAMEGAINVETSTLWSTRSIQVCWENPTSGNERDRRAIKEAVEYWWNYRAGFELHGWNRCGGNEDVRVIVTDDEHDDTYAPHVKAIGKNLRDLPNGVVFPHTYKNHWRTECRVLRRWECQQEYAVHEFGHVLGFHHEQGRADTPEWCTEADARQSPFETYGSPWDPESVMGYCSSPRLGGGQLSGFDIFYSMWAYGNDQGKAYFFEHWSDGKTGKKTGWYQGSGCQDVFGHHNDIYSAVMLGRGVAGVRVFQDAGCSGPSQVLTQSTFLGDWNDRISSLQVLY